MGQQVVMGAMLQCSFGAAPSSLAILPSGSPVTAGGTFAANIMDFKPMVNILPFGMCSSLANPTVAAATAAASGVLTPMPCVPVTTPWVVGVPSILINNLPALNNSAKCMCSWGGVISINSAGQFTVEVP